MNKIGFKNYKGFLEGEIWLKPLTIILGPNNSGKSSLLKLLLMLSQTSNVDPTYNAAIKIHGRYLSMGNLDNIFHQKNVESKIEISFELPAKEVKESIDELFKNLKREVGILLLQSQIPIEEREKTVSFKTSKKKVKVPLQEVVKGDFDSISEKQLDSIFNVITSKEEVQREGRLNRMIYSDKKHLINFNSSKQEDNKKDILLGFDFMNQVAIEDIQTFKVIYTIVANASKDFFEVFDLKVLAGEKLLIKIDFDQQDDFKIKSIKSDFLNTNLFDSKLFSSIKRSKTGKSMFFLFSNSFSSEVKPTTFSLVLTRVINILLGSLQEKLAGNKINYVSPLRAHPKRYYFLDKAKIHSYLDTLDGDAIAEILKENPSLKKKVNDWLKRFEVEIDVPILEDVIHRLEVSEGGLKLDITDVGFGLSQVLPVLLQGFLSEDFSSTIIEQPEIHLHPKAQADLAELFIEIVSTKTSLTSERENSIYKTLIIETHSEYLLKRLRRLISEGKFDNNLVNIVTIERDKDRHVSTIVNNIPDEKGNFNYPRNFYADELLADTTIFLKNQ